MHVSITVQRGCLTFIALCSVGMLKQGVAVGAAADAATAASEEAGKLEEVTVTARKTEESLQRVPISVSALSANELQARSIDNLSAVSESTPNFTFGQQPQGGKASNVVFIRGVGQRDTLATYDAAVGIYLDGVYLGRMQANDLDMLEVQRIEVLRGPQGTLFGKNTSGGAVNIVTKQPDASANGIDGRVAATTGSHARLDVLGNVNIPLVTDKLAIELSGVHRKQDPYGFRADGEGTDDVNRNAFRAQILYKPTETISATLSSDITHYDEDNTTFKLVGVNTGIPTIGALNFFTNSHYDNRYLAPSDYYSYATGPNASYGTLWGNALTLSVDTGWGVVKSISAFRHNDIINQLDPDQSPVTVIDQFQNVEQHQFSQELQASGKSLAGRLDWVSGLYYFSELTHDDSSYNLLVPLLGNAAGFTQALQVANRSYAVYGQGTYSLTDQLRMTLGLRYTHDLKDVTRARPQFPTGVPIQPTLTKSRTSTGVSPRVGFDYQWTPAVMTYVSMAEGYKGGGFNGRSGSVADFNEFGDEKVWTYEAGIRSDLLDRRLRVNLTGFYSDYRDLQLPINGSQIINGAPVPFASVVNIPKSRVSGAELELAYVPVAGLTLQAGFGATDARYTELPTDARFVNAGTINMDKKFPNTPDLSYSLGAEYSAYVGSGITSTIRVDYSYKSTIYYNPENTPLLRQPGYGLLNARWTFFHDPSGLSIALFGTNLTAKHYILGGYDDAQSPSPGLGFAIVNPGAPREWGVTAQYKF